MGIAVRWQLEEEMLNLKTKLNMKNQTSNETGAANDGNTLLADSYKLHWAIRLRKKLLIKGTWKWNAWVRDYTAWAEVNL